MRFSAMLMFDMIFTRLMIAGWSRRGGLSTSWSTPSTRYLTRNFLLIGSRWMSDPRLRNASRIRRLTSLMIGASDSVTSWSSASRSCSPVGISTDPSVISPSIDSTVPLVSG